MQTDAHHGHAHHHSQGHGRHKGDASEPRHEHTVHLSLIGNIVEMSLFAEVEDGRDEYPSEAEAHSEGNERG